MPASRKVSPGFLPAASYTQRPEHILTKAPAMLLGCSVYLAHQKCTEVTAGTTPACPYRTGAAEPANARKLLTWGSVLPSVDSRTTSGPLPTNNQAELNVCVGFKGLSIVVSLAGSMIS